MSENDTDATEVTDAVSETSEDVQPAATSSNLEEVIEPDAEDQADDDTFPRSVVEELRRENGRYRQRAQQADELAHRLHTELVRATGRLADPSDLDYDDAHLDDPDALTTAIDDLLERKPHLATRRPSGDIGQGQRGPASGSFSLLDTLKGLT